MLFSLAASLTRSPPRPPLRSRRKWNFRDYPGAATASSRAASPLPPSSEITVARLVVDALQCRDVVSPRIENKVLVREIDALRRLKDKALSSSSASALQSRPLAATPDFLCSMIVNREVSINFSL